MTAENRVKNGDCVEHLAERVTGHEDSSEKPDFVREQAPLGVWLSPKLHLGKERGKELYLKKMFETVSPVN